ncbi:MAG: hypothetical protein GWN07_10505, partial [Actinobacteria bacterium]|nr:hypothetical protein [Actinomycetota bacterium]NIS30725.1 hypothetical protein [Actinomycetota bacterium]NIT95246.1 hypothetical protein [Actinomycetota bacterium]NIU65937.1 hypothetical protein [Actinomycetota bacterium]NIV55410.1 hypothetical protein [Actinomycetota bacterium]
MNHHRSPSFKTFSTALCMVLGVSGAASAQECPDPDTVTAGFTAAAAHVRYLA